MTRIGAFTRETTGFVGRIHTLTLYCELTIVQAEASVADKAPDYRIRLGNEDGPEIGAGWKHTGEHAGEFVALLIDDPALPQPIRANLFRDDDFGNAWSLRWSRLPKREGKD